MSALRWALQHPLNRRRRVSTLFRWAFHNARRRLTPQRIIVQRFAGGLVEGPVDHPISNLIYYARGGYYDFDAMKALEELLEPGQTFVDVGANIGSYSVLAGSLVGPGGHILAIEPSTSQLPHLRANLSRIQGDVTISAAAVADRRRFVSLVAADPTTAFADEHEHGTLQTTTLDEEIARAGIGGGGFAKIDIEGWEPAAILGAEIWLRSGPLGLLVEANGLNLRSPIPWNDAVNVLLEHDLEFTWPDFRKGMLHIFEAPAPVSPFGDYLVLPTQSRRRLERIFK